MAQILLIDDDHSIHQITALFLEEAGHDVHSAISGPEGLELAARYQPDLILLDVALPGMDGFQTLRMLKDNARTQNIPVMFFTVHDREDLDPDVDTQGLAGYLKKPMDMHTLQAGVDKALQPATPLH